MKSIRTLLKKHQLKRSCAMVMKDLIAQKALCEEASLSVEKLELQINRNQVRLHNLEQAYLDQVDDEPQKMLETQICVQADALDHDNELLKFKRTVLNQLQASMQDKEQFLVMTEGALMQRKIGYDSDKIIERGRQFRKEQHLSLDEVQAIHQERKRANALTGQTNNSVGHPRLEALESKRQEILRIRTTGDEKVESVTQLLCRG
ncbi:MAG: hypothetical protein EOM15_15775 [Spirochaetia bacterium]|nr:hypothetical protein [Spirochaetia bacterium]